MRQVRELHGFSDLIDFYIRDAETLRFTGFDETTELTGTFPNFTKSMPNLRSLTFDGSGDSHFRKDRTDPFKSSIPTLTYLKLVNIPIYPSFLRLRGLTELVLHHSCQFSLRLDTLLGLLEENRSLKSVHLGISLTGVSSFDPPRRAAIVNQLQHLSITHKYTDHSRALLHKIPLQRGAHLEIVINTNDWNESKEVLLGIPVAQFPILLSPISMEYQSHKRSIQLLGPNGRFSFRSSYNNHGSPFVEFPSLPLTDVREFLLKHRGSGRSQEIYPVVFKPSVFPALEIFAIDCDIQVSHLLSTLLSNPLLSPSLKTLAFLNCDLSGDSMEALTRFASDRTKTTSAWLRRVVIVDSGGNFPSVDSINALRKHVPVVNVSVGEELPTDLA